MLLMKVILFIEMWFRRIHVALKTLFFFANPITIDRCKARRQGLAIGASMYC